MQVRKIESQSHKKEHKQKAKAEEIIASQSGPGVKT
jgi:hypothetical protein